MRPWHLGWGCQTTVATVWTLWHLLPPGALPTARCQGLSPEGFSASTFCRDRGWGGRQEGWAEAWAGHQGQGTHPGAREGQTESGEGDLRPDLGSAQWAWALLCLSETGSGPTSGPGRSPES